MNNTVFIVEKAEEGAYYRAERESIFTQGDTLVELMFNIDEAIHCYFDGPGSPLSDFKFINPPNK